MWLFQSMRFAAKFNYNNAAPNLFRIFQLPAKRQIYVDTWKQFPEISRINMSTHDK